MSFGERLRYERRRLGLTQDVFADLGGVKRLSEHLYEQDVRFPDVGYLLRLLEHDVDVGFLVFGYPSAVETSEPGVSIRVATAAFRAVDQAMRSKGAKLTVEDGARMFSSLCKSLMQEQLAEQITTGTRG